LKKSILATILIFSLILSSCSAHKNLQKTNMDNSSSYKSNTNTEKASKNAIKNVNKNISVFTIKNYYPFKPNVKYVYEGNGMEYASYTVFVDYFNDDRIQIRTNNGGTEVVKVLENKAGELNIILNKPEIYYRENFITKPAMQNEIILKNPIIKGTTWTLADGRKRYISNVDVQINTPSGNFKALEVTTESDAASKGDKVLDYYAQGVGLVKTMYTSKGVSVTSTLSKIVNNSSLVQSVTFYYPNITDSKLYFVKKDLSFNTNDVTKIYFEKAFKESPKNELGKLLSPNAKIKSLYLSNNNIVFIDFSKEFVSEMNAGSGYEAMILQCITNTIGGYYGVNKVYITVEGQPYSSGHIVMKKGEAFTVNTKNSIELKS
jgi:hypothetical protein